MSIIEEDVAVVVEVSGGVVQRVSVSDPYIKVQVIDYDNEEELDEEDVRKALIGYIPQD